jgi:hypothetical protein
MRNISSIHKTGKLPEGAKLVAVGDKFYYEQTDLKSKSKDVLEIGKNQLIFKHYKPNSKPDTTIFKGTGNKNKDSKLKFECNTIMSNSELI